MKFSVVKFFAYNIRSTVLSGVKMYLVSDLLNQYNAVHKTNKEFRSYLQNKQTQELLQNWHTNFDHQDPDDQKFIDDEQTFWDIDRVIKHVSFHLNTQGGVNKGYVVCEELLIACLMWADPQFAISVYTFLKNCREKDNDFLKKENMKLRNRYIPNSKKSQWSYILTVNEEDDNIILRSRYVHQTLKGMKIKDEKIYCVKNLPNGYVFKSIAYENLLPIVEQYGGHKTSNKSVFIIPRESWNADHKYFTKDVRLALQKTRKDLCWRTDLELDEDLE